MKPMHYVLNVNQLFNGNRRNIMFNYTKQCTQYSITLSDRQILRIKDLDSITITSGCLYTILEQIPGIHNIDYDLHFGAQISLYIDADYDNSKTRQTINNTIKIYLDRKL